MLRTMPNFTITDEVLIDLYDHQLLRIKMDPILTTPLRNTYSQDVSWQVELYTAMSVVSPCLTIRLQKTADIMLPLQLIVNGKTIPPVRNFEESLMSYYGFPYDYLRKEMTDGMITLKIKVHRHFLALISPVFNAMLTNDTKENRLGKSEIEDFDYDTVKLAIDFCYGRQVDLPIEIAIGVLRFADKYDIKAVMAELQHIPFVDKITKDNFCKVVHYAFDMSLEALTLRCGEFFKQKQDSIINSRELEKLPIAVTLHFLSTVYDANNKIEVSKMACRSNLDFITEYLEPLIIKDLAMDSFCSTASYVWKYSRDNVKQVCAEFFNNNKDAIMNLPEFVNLHPLVISDVLKAAFDLRNPET
uniref:BTB domain-containing protein n=1 Tax=Panagrellus redivivus TaxID=6233 RepID=A0A7E4UUB5_PANRE